MTIRGAHPADDRRYRKFAWNSSANLPPIGKFDHEPKDGGAFYMFQEGKFVSDGCLQRFEMVKAKRKLPALGSCAYCPRTPSDGDHFRLTDEHIVSDFLGGGLELREASCPTCQD